MAACSATNEECTSHDSTSNLRQTRRESATSEPAADISHAPQQVVPNSYIIMVIQYSGKFGEVLINFGDLATLRKIAKFKTAKYCNIALCVCDRYRSSPNLPICSVDGFAKFNARQIFPLYSITVAVAI